MGYAPKGYEPVKQALARFQEALGADDAMAAFDTLRAEIHTYETGRQASPLRRRREAPFAVALPDGDIRTIRPGAWGVDDVALVIATKGTVQYRETGDDIERIGFQLLPTEQLEQELKVFLHIESLDALIADARSPSQSGLSTSEIDDLLQRACERVIEAASDAGEPGGTDQLYVHVQSEIERATGSKRGFGRDFIRPVLTPLISKRGLNSQNPSSKYSGSKTADVLANLAPLNPR